MQFGLVTGCDRNAPPHILGHAGGLTCLEPGRGAPLSQIKRDTFDGLTIFDHAMKANKMFNSSQLSGELQALKVDVAQLLNATREGFVDASKVAADALADEITAGLNELRETLGDEDSHIGQLIANRPIASLGSAFVLGVVVGLAMRRH
jgi:hypothetical protein